MPSLRRLLAVSAPSPKRLGSPGRLPGAVRTLLLATAVAAAEPLAAQTSFSTVAGLNRTSFSGPGSAGASARSGFLIGAAAETPVTRALSIRPELHVSMKGARVLSWLGTRGYGNFSLVYAQASLLGQIGTPPGSTVRPLFYGGMSVGVALACSLAERDCRDLDGFERQSADVSIVWGGEVEFSRAAVGIRYESGLWSVNAQAPNALNNAVWSVTARWVVLRRSRRPAEARSAAGRS